MDFIDYNENEDLEIDNQTSIPREYEVDANGNMTGRILEGSEALKIWAKNALLTARYRYITCPWDYGSELEGLIGTVYSDEYTEALAKKNVEECLTSNEHITGISNFTATFSGNKLTLAFTMQTEYGEEALEVNV